jgi:hypothetical protein
MKRNVLTVGAALSFLALLAYGVSAGVNPGVQAGASAPQLEGTWRVTVTVPPGAPPGTPPVYPGVASFARGGVLITAPDPSVGPSVTSTGQGTWVRTGGNQFASTHVAFTYDSGGHITGTIRIKSSYRLTGEDTFEGSGQLQFCDSSLNNCFTPSGCPALATLRGERINAEPPSCPE